MVDWLWEVVEYPFDNQIHGHDITSYFHFPPGSGPTHAKRVFRDLLPRIIQSRVLGWMDSALAPEERIEAIEKDRWLQTYSFYRKWNVGPPSLKVRFCSTTTDNELRVGVHDINLDIASLNSIPPLKIFHLRPRAKAVTFLHAEVPINFVVHYSGTCLVLLDLLSLACREPAFLKQVWIALGDTIFQVKPDQHLLDLYLHLHDNGEYEIFAVNPHELVNPRAPLLGTAPPVRGRHALRPLSQPRDFTPWNH